MPPEMIDSLPDEVKPLVLELLRQNSELTARVGALLARIAELEAKHGKPPKTPDNSSLPPSHGQKGNVAEPPVKKARKGHPGFRRARSPKTRTRHASKAEAAQATAKLSAVEAKIPSVMQISGCIKKIPHNR